MLRARGLGVAFPDRTIATVDHIVPTRDQRRPFIDVMAEDMLSALERNCREHGIRLLDLSSGKQGIVHVIGPELGLTQPGMTIACGDSHTSTHGAFGAVAFGIGTSQVRDVLASQCLAMDPLKVRRIARARAARPRRLREGRDPRDHPPARRERGRRIRLRVRRRHASTRMSMDERMTICNMSIEGGARVGYVNPDQTTFDYLRGPSVRAAGRRLRAGRARGGARWRRIADAPYDDEVDDRRGVDPADRDVGHQPGQSVGDRRAAAAPDADRRGARVHGLPARAAAEGHADRRRVRRLVHQRPAVGPPRGGTHRLRGHHVAPHVKALVVPGSQAVRAAAEREGLDRVFIDAGFEWRGAGCSMCLAMNPDRLEGRRDLRLVVEPELQGTAGESDRTHAADEPRDGGRGGGRRRSRGRPGIRLGGGWRWPLNRFSAISGTGGPAARRRHRHRSHHPRALSEGHHVRGARAASLRGRSPAGAGDHPLSNPAYRAARDHARERELRLRLVARACAAGDSPIAASARSSASRSRRSSSAIPWRSVLRVPRHPPRSLRELMEAVERDPSTTLAVDLSAMRVTCGDRRVSAVASGGNARCAR